MPKNGDTVWFLDFDDTPTEGVIVGLSDTSDGDIRYRIKSGDWIFSVEDILIYQSRDATLTSALDHLEREMDDFVSRLHVLEARAMRLRSFIGG